MQRLIRLMTCAVSVLVIGCGSVTDANSPDGGSTGDTTAPAIATTNPADNAGHVSVIAPIEVTMTEPLDPASVGDDTLTLADRWGVPIPGSVTYDDARATLVFTPLQPLAHDAHYVVTLAPVRDPAGNESSEATTSFATLVNAPDKELSYTGGVLASLAVHTHDADGRVMESVHYQGPGPDGVWETADDQLGSRSERTYENGNLTHQTFWTAGPDGVWNTADDTISGVHLNIFDSLGRRERFRFLVGAGADGQWGTADDEVNYGYDFTYEGDSGDLKSLAVIGDPGADGVWHTADDVISYHNRYEYHRPGLRSREIRVDGPGSDGVWGNADDLVSSYVAYHVDATGFVVSRTGHPGPGVDGVWFTADDEISSYTLYTNRSNGQPQRARSFNDPGLDAQWMTGDDVMTSYTDFEYDERNLLLGLRRYTGPGPDGTLGTADDPLASYQTNSFDSAGARVDYNNVEGPGPDGVWFTADDISRFRGTFKTDR